MKRWESLPVFHSLQLMRWLLYSFYVFLIYQLIGGVDVKLNTVDIENYKKRIENCSKTSGQCIKFMNFVINNIYMRL